MSKNIAKIAMVVVLGASLFAGESRTFKVNYDFDLKSDGNYSAKLWVPMPRTNSYQQVVDYNFSGNYNSFNINTNNDYKAKTLFASWKKGNTPKKLHITMLVKTEYRSVPLDKIKEASKKNLPIPDSVKKYILPTAHIPTDGIEKALAKRIIGNKTDRFEQVQAIYDWCTAHTFRDKKVIGCGLGDVHKMITQKEVEDAYKNGLYGGKCTDLSSLFTALTRAAGIPAREVFGIRLGKSHFSKALGKSDDKGFANITTWQHCRAEYYIPGFGWVPTDPADITKLELVEKLKYNDKKVQELKKKYINSWEMNWMAFNHGRDFVLSPKPAQFPINTFGYPYAEVNNEDVLNYYEPKTFSYTITSQEVK